MCIAEGDPSTILLRKIASGTAQDDSGGRLPFSETLIIKRRGAPMCAPVLRCKAEASLKRKPPPLLVMGEVPEGRRVIPLSRGNVAKRQKGCRPATGRRFLYPKVS